MAISRKDRCFVYMDKKKRYQELVLKVKTDYNNRDREQSRSNVRLNWFDACQEINLWTYWQGRGNFDPKIMLVGQDWGSPGDKSANNTIEQIQLANNHQPYDYLRNNPSKTDANLNKNTKRHNYMSNLLNRVSTN